MSPATNNWR